MISIVVVHFKESKLLNMNFLHYRWPFIPLTNSDGDRIYVRLDSEDTWDKSLDTAAEHASLHSMYASTWEEARKLVSNLVQLLFL